MKKMMILSVILAVAAVLAVSGCATYNTRGAIPILSSIEEKKLVKLEKEGIIIIAFPIATEEDSKKYFDENLLGYRIVGERILAVYLDVSNKTSSAVKITSVSLKVGEAVIPLTTAEVVYKAIKREYVGKAFLWMLPTYFVGAIPSVIHTSVINTRIEEDVKSKQFVLGAEIKAAGSAQGFIWFRVPDKVVFDESKGFPKEMMLDLAIQIGKEKLARFILAVPNPK